MSAPIQIVDEFDRPVRAASKQEAWADGLWHRIVRIMLEDGGGNLLLQHRTPTKDIYPDCWDNSAAGHVDAGEDYDDAAYRELAEELGIRNLPLEVVGSYIDEHEWQGKHFKRFVRVYKAMVSPDRVTLRSPEPDKIDAIRWFTTEQAKRLVSEKSDEVSDGLAQVMTRYY